jgi:hypothetical protein
MFYQLPNGKVIEMTVEQYLDMTDEELEYLIAFNYGDHLENPWIGSVLNKAEPEQISDEQPSNLINVTDHTKFKELDADIQEE